MGILPVTNAYTCIMGILHDKDVRDDKGIGCSGYQRINSFMMQRFCKVKQHQKSNDISMKLPFILSILDPPRKKR